MSKTEMATGSGRDSAPSQLIRQIRELQRQMEQSRAEIEQLPPAIAQQVTEALKPLEGLSLGEIERLAQIQRTTLNAMATDLTTQATASFETSTRRLLTTIQSTSDTLESSMSRLETAATAATTLEEQARAARPRWWKMPAVAVGSAVLTVLLATSVGMLDSNAARLLGDDQTLQRIMDNATRAESALLMEIYSRSGE